MVREAGINDSYELGYYYEPLKRFEALVRADEAAKYTWDVHSCGPTCTKAACVAMREAVEAERKACEALYEHEDVQAPVGNSAWGEAYQDGWIAGAQAYRDAIRARGNT